jgi:type IV pilus assembly protein PilW
MKAIKHRPGRSCAGHRQAGLTLVEMMIALAIGAFLMIGAVSVFVNSRDAQRTSDTLARMQENARLALSVLETELLHAGYWGMNSTPGLIQGIADATDPVVFPVAGDCGVNFSVNLLRPIDGVNNGYGLGCGANGGGPQANADTLVIRRASIDPAPPTAGRLQIQTDRLRGQIFNDGIIPGGFPAAPDSATHDLVTRAYYIAQGSSVGADVPGLRRKTLQAGPAIVDEEIIPGVEDLQVQLGVDTSPPGTAGRGTVSRYVNPGHPILDPANAAYDPDAQVVSVRIWLIMRSENQEGSFQDNQDRAYADQVRPATNDRFRRALVSKTILLRNRRSI